MSSRFLEWFTVLGGATGAILAAIAFPSFSLPLLFTGLILLLLALVAGTIRLKRMKK